MFSKVRLGSLQRSCNAFHMLYSLKIKPDVISPKQLSKRFADVCRNLLKTIPKVSSNMRTLNFTPNLSKDVTLKFSFLFTAMPLGAYVTFTVAGGKTRLDSLYAIFSSCIVTAHCHSTVDQAPTQDKHTVVSIKRPTSQGFLVKAKKNLLLFLYFVKLCLTFGPLLMTYPLGLVSPRFYSAWLGALLYVVQTSGPAYIKLGQWASTRRDLFSAEFCDKFCELHTRVKVHDWCHTECALRKAYGWHWREVLKLDEAQVPLGSGCVAQVYKGYIHTKNLLPETLDVLEEDLDETDDIYFRDGIQIHSLMENMHFEVLDKEEDEHITSDGSGSAAGPQISYADDPDYVTVAVKVLHPGVHEQFSCDLTLMRKTARFLEFVIPSLRWINLTECVQEFSESMKKQMNMIHEARSLKRFHRDFADMASVKIPVPMMAFVRRNILVESFEEGEAIGNFIQQKDVPEGLRQKLADIGVDALLHMVFTKNFVHGDLHPGNILVQNADAFEEQTADSVVMVDVGDVLVTAVAPTPCPLRLVLLDCGITTSLDPDDREKFIAVFTAVVKGQGEVVADLFLERSQHVECSDPEAFRRDMADIVNRARKVSLQLSQIKVSVLLSEVFSVLTKHRVKLESNFANIMLAVAVLEGLGRSLDPDLDILSKARNILLEGLLTS